MLLAEEQTLVWWENLLWWGKYCPICAAFSCNTYSFFLWQDQKITVLTSIVPFVLPEAGLLVVDDFSAKGGFCCC